MIKDIILVSFGISAVWADQKVKNKVSPPFGKSSRTNLPPKRENSKFQFCINIVDGSKCFMMLPVFKQLLGE